MLTALVDELAAALATTGRHVATDPRNAHPPCVLVLPERVEPRTACRFDVELRVLLIAPGIGNGDALAVLDELLSDVMGALPRHTAAQLAAWTSPHTGEQLLAWQLPYRATLTTNGDTP